MMKILKEKWFKIVLLFFKFILEYIGILLIAYSLGFNTADNTKCIMFCTGYFIIRVILIKEILDSK